MFRVLKFSKEIGCLYTMPRLNSDSRNQITGKLNARLSQGEVARRFGVNVSTASWLNSRYCVTGSTKDCPRPGQPHITTRRQDNFIRLHYLRDRFEIFSDKSRFKFC